MGKYSREWLAGYVDGELSQEDERTFAQELARNPELQAELEEFTRLKEVTGMAHYADLPEEVWENYWESLYKKTERGLGWILFSVGAILLGCFTIFQLFEQMYSDPTTPLLIKVGVTALCFGLVILLVSILRERLFSYRRDRYKEVTR